MSQECPRGALQAARHSAGEESFLSSTGAVSRGEMDGEVLHPSGAVWRGREKQGALLLASEGGTRVSPGEVKTDSGPLPKARKEKFSFLAFSLPARTAFRMEGELLPPSFSPKSSDTLETRL